MDENAPHSPPPPPPPPPVPANAGTGRQTSSLAVVSLVAGLLGWSLMPWLGSVVAIITGHMARTEIRRNPDTMDGDGLAVAGLVLGWAMIALTVAGILLAILFFGGIVACLAALAAFAHLH